MDVVRTGTWGLAQPGENYMGSIDTLLVIYPEMRLTAPSLEAPPSLEQFRLHNLIFSQRCFPGITLSISQM